MPTDRIHTPASTRRHAIRVLVAVGLGAVILAAIWCYWDREADRRLRDRLAAVRDSGDMTAPADFIADDLPQDQNAATYLVAAAGAMAAGVTTPSLGNNFYSGYPPFPAFWHRMADAAVSANARPLELVRQARGFDRARWATGPASPMFASLLPHLNGQRQLANLLADAALYAHVHGDDAEAFERIDDLLHQAAMMGDGGFTVIDWLVGTGIDVLAVDRIEVIAADGFAVADRPPTTATTTTTRGDSARPVPRQVVNALIAQLLDDTAWRQRQRRAVWGERMIGVDTYQWLAGSSVLLRPLLKLQAVYLIDDREGLVVAADQPNLPAAQACIPRTQRQQWPPRASRAFLWVAAQPLGRAVVAQWRDVAERRLAAVALAARLYHVDHGSWPVDLNALVPVYLPAVPVDPFAIRPAPVGYMNDRGRPLLFVDPPGYPCPGNAPAYPCFSWQNTPDRQWRDLSLAADDMK